MTVPADHSVTVQTLGALGTVKMMTKAALSYRHTMAFMIRRRHFRSLANLIYTKTLVPTGEGSGELAYYAIGSLLQRYPQLAWYPRNIEVEITSRCNKRCIICEHTWWKEESVDLSLEAFKYLTNQFNLRWINMTGEGDAFLNKDYLDMIRHIKQRGTSVYLVDSMDLVTEDIAFNLVALGVDGIYISMDGATRETYEAIKVGCSYDKVIDNIRGLLNAKRITNSPLPEICFRYVINKWNVHEMSSFVHLVNALGRDYNWGDGSKIHFVGLLDYPEIHDLYLDTISPAAIAATIETSNGNMPVVFAHIQQHTNPSINRCLAFLEPYFALVPHHMALPCCAVLMSNQRAKLVEYSFGNYLEEPFRDIWNSTYYRWFRRSVTKRDGPVPFLCAGCRAYDTKERIEKYGVDYRKRGDFE